jgi:flagellar motor switch protein FliN/FliY
MDQTALEVVDTGDGSAAISPSLAATLEQVDGIADVPLPIEVELDRKILSVRAILALSIGSVLRLSRSAGENIDIRIGGSLVGFGEIVILEDSIGVRITDFWGET